MKRVDPATKRYELKLRSARQEYWITKISMGQNTDEGRTGDYYELGWRKWLQMARDRFLSLEERDLDFAIGCLENYADNAFDNQERADEQSAKRLAQSLRTLKAVR